MARANTTRIKLGDVVMDAVVKESPSFDAEVTQKPVEKGEDISDHMKTKPYSLQLSGSMVKDAAAKLQVLLSYQKEAKLLKYVGRGIYTDMVITKLDTDHGVKNAKGFDYNMTISHVKIAKPETFEVNVKNPKTKKQDAKTATKVKKKTNSGRKQVKHR